MKALERDRERRYGTPSELAADLRRYLNDEPVMARSGERRVSVRQIRPAPSHRRGCRRDGDSPRDRCVGLPDWSPCGKQHEAEYQAAQALQAQSRLLTQAAAQRLKDSDVAGAQGIILEVLTNPAISRRPTRRRPSVCFRRSARPIRSSRCSRATASMSIPLPTRRTARASSPRRRIRPRASGMRARARSSPCSPATALRQFRRLFARRHAHRHCVRWTRPRASGMRARAHSSPCCQATASASIPPPIRPTARASSPRRWTRPRASGMRARARSSLVLSGHDGDIFIHAAYSPDGTRIVTASADKTARIWDARTGAQLAVLSRSCAIALILRLFRPTARASSPRRTTRPRASGMHAPARNSPCSRGIADRVDSAAYSPDGTRIVTASYRQDRAHLGCAHGRAARRTFGPWRRCRQIRRLLARRHSHRHRIGRQDRTHLGCAHRCAARRALRASDDYVIAARLLARRHTHRHRRSVGQDRADLGCAHGHAARGACRPQRRRRFGRLFAGRQPHRHRVVGQDRAHLGCAHGLRRSPCCPATASRPCPPPSRPTARALSLHRSTRPHGSGMRARGAQLAALSGHGDIVSSAAYSPDGTRIVTASVDKTARIWDARTGAQLVVLSGHDGIGHVRRLLARRHTHRHRLVGQDRAHLGCAHGRAARRALRTWRESSIPPPTRPTAHASSPRRRTRPRASGMRTRRAARRAIGPWRWRLFGRLLARRHTHRHRVGRQDRAYLGCARQANIAAQILWEASAAADPLPEVDRAQLGLPPDPRQRSWPTKGSACDQSRRGSL